MNYYKVMSGDNELLAIAIELNGAGPQLEWISLGLAIYIDKNLGFKNWSYDTITQSEFGTYQAFGIKEIRHL